MEYTGQNQGRQGETYHPAHRFQRLFLDPILMGWRGYTNHKKRNIYFTPHMYNLTNGEMDIMVYSDKFSL